MLAAPSGREDILVIRLDPLGRALWTEAHTFGGTGVDVGRSIFETTGGNFLLAGYSSSYADGARREKLWANLLSKTGNVLWKEPLFFGGTSAYLDTLVDCVPGVAVGFEHGASDARYLTARGIPGVVWGADGEMSQHAADEHVVISSLATIYNHLDTFITAIEARR